MLHAKRSWLSARRSDEGPVQHNKIGAAQQNSRYSVHVGPYDLPCRTNRSTVHAGTSLAPKHVPKP